VPLRNYSLTLTLTLGLTLLTLLILTLLTLYTVLLSARIKLIVVFDIEK